MYLMNRLTLIYTFLVHYEAQLGEKSKNVKTPPFWRSFCFQNPNEMPQENIQTPSKGLWIWDSKFEILIKKFLKA